MTAEQLYAALAGKPITPERLLKAARRADNPEAYAEALRRLIADGKVSA